MPLAGYTVSFVGSPLRFEARAGQTLLAAALAAGVRLPSACRNGSCRECRCRVLHGSAVHVIEWPGLSAEEKREGWILPCVARPESDLTLDAPRAALA
ncbi:MAG: 2Fe-2S iron-sulfur cluster binding domain-containing protein [Rhizobacter sp.]|nr:2Fe-2S iron-sulfur cluster binding domain-containing protein [Rhizobacter sp.]